MAKKLHKKKKTKKKKKKKTRRIDGEFTQQNQSASSSEPEPEPESESQLVLPAQEEEDRISKLPDDILQNIISLIPCASTSIIKAEMWILSIKWWNFWNRVTEKHEYKSIEDIVAETLSFVDSALDTSKAFNCLRKLVFHAHESGHVFIGTMAAYKKLHLDFSHNDDDSDNWWANLGLLISKQHPYSEITPAINSIRLTAANFLHRIDIVSSLIDNIPSLRSIDIRESKGLSNIEIWGSKGERLRKLWIIDCDVGSIEISRFRLRSFRYRGSCPSMKFVMVHYFHYFDDAICRDIMLDFRKGPTPSSTNHPFKSLRFLDLAWYLTICQWTFEAMIRPILHSSQQFDDLKDLKELWWIDRYMDEDNIDSLITFLKVCPNLEKLFVTVDPMCYSLPSNCKRKRDVLKDRVLQPLRSLNYVKMDGIEHEEDELLLADQILKTVEGEPIVVATSGRRKPRRLKRLNPNWERQFVRENDSVTINAKHIHMSL